MPIDSSHPLFRAPGRIPYSNLKSKNYNVVCNFMHYPNEGKKICERLWCCGLRLSPLRTCLGMSFSCFRFHMFFQGKHAQKVLNELFATTENKTKGRNIKIHIPIFNSPLLYLTNCIRINFVLYYMNETSISTYGKRCS